MTQQIRVTYGAGGQFAILSLVFSLFSFARSTTPAFHSVLYAEDGVWLGLILTDGPLTAAMEARESFPTLMNVALLAVAILLSLVFSASPIWLAAGFVSALGYLLWGITAAAIYRLFVNRSSKAFALLMALGFVFMPLGSSSDETVGRILQLQFLVPVWFLLLILARIDGRVSSAWGLGVAVGLLNLTFPVVSALVVGVVAVEIALRFACWRKIFDDWKIALSAIMFSGLFIFSREPTTGGIPGGLDAGTVIETVAARAVLYPVVSGFYSHMNDVISLLLVILFIGLVTLASLRAANRRELQVVVLSLITLLIYLAITIISRPGLTAILSEYSTTFPDRYYLGLNTIAWIVLGLAISNLTSHSHSKSRFGRHIGAVVITPIILMNVVFTLMTNSTQIYDAGFPTWQEAICHAKLYPVHDLSGNSRVPIPPLDNLGVTLPTRLLNDVDCSR